MTLPTVKSTLITAVCLSLMACTTTSTKQGEVGVDRQQLLLVSEAEMTKGGAAAYSAIIKEAKAKKTLNTDPKVLARVQTIANRLIPQTAVFRADAPKWAWEVNVLKSDQINAWCMPGGKIAFYTGIIDKLQLTDAEMAAIMGHEISHALREHGRERASRAQLSQAGLTALSLFTGVRGATLDAAAMALNVTVTLPNSREHEVEADRIGIELAARAGYDPYAAVTLWQKMAKQSNGQQPPQFLSTHPSHGSRIDDLKKYAQKVQPLYLQAKQR